MKIISISGLDGSGKSTQVKLLKSFFRQQNKEVFYFHAIQFSIAQKIKKLFAGKNFQSTKEKGVTSASWIKIKLRQLAFLIDVLRFKYLVKKLTRDGFDYLVTDRYFYDSIINITYLMGKNCPPKIEKYIPPADLAFYLKLEPEAIMKRRRIPEQGLTYLKKKKKRYDMYANFWNLIIINANANQETIFNKILSEINRFSPFCCHHSLGNENKSSFRSLRSTIKKSSKNLFD